MAKTYDEKDYFGKQNYLTEQAGRYGIDLDEYEINGNNSGREFGDDLKSMADLENEIARNMSMDYDVREAIAAGINSGNERFEGLGDGISDIDEAFAATKAMKQTHKKDLGNSGNFSSANDYSNVSGYLNKSAAASAEDAIMNKVNSQISQAMTRDDADSSSSETNTNMTYNEFLGLEGEVQKASSGFGATDTPAQQAQDMLFNAVNEIASDEDKMNKSKYNQDRYNLELGSKIFN